MRVDMVAILPEEFEAMKARLPRTTAEGLFDTYRISQGTWYKLRDGLPVKLTTVERLRARYAQVASE